MSKPSHPTGAEHTSKSWMPNFVRRESELTLSFALTLQIPTDHGMVITPETVQCIHLQRPSLCCIQHHTPHTWWVHLTSGQKRQMAVGEKGKQFGGTCPMHICSVWSQPARSHLLQRACPQGSRTLGQLQAFRFQPQPLKLLFHQ